MIARCPDCGSPLELLRFTDVWDTSGKPTERSEDWYCPMCGVRWVPYKDKPDEVQEAMAP